MSPVRKAPRFSQLKLATHIWCGELAEGFMEDSSFLRPLSLPPALPKRKIALTQAIVEIMIANIGFGPLLREWLKLRTLFNLSTNQPHVTRELAVGLAELYIGGLQRAGRYGVIQSLALFTWVMGLSE